MEDETMDRTTVDGAVMHTANRASILLTVDELL